MITVHHLNQSRSKRVIWLLEELGMPYELVHHQRDPKTNLAPPSLAAIHPLSKSPVIVDGERTLCESGAVMEYLLDQDPEQTLRPAKTADNYYDYLEWLHFAEGSLAMPVIINMIMKKEERAGNQPLDGYIAKELALDINYIEATLSGRDYIAGDRFTAADIMVSMILEIAFVHGLLTGKASTLAYLSKLQARDAYKKTASFG
ncbi:glutathione S-transferase family protein [Zhongshania sp.]|uniref:glutathione S-transferase family protein n=1 Tax=Zhongshania sp. TaxID=1971902 RepID=UPI0035693980